MERKSKNIIFTNIVRFWKLQKVKILAFFIIYVKWLYSVMQSDRNTFWYLSTFFILNISGVLSNGTAYIA